MQHYVVRLLNASWSDPPESIILCRLAAVLSFLYSFLPVLYLWKRFFISNAIVSLFGREYIVKKYRASELFVKNRGRSKIPTEFLSALVFICFLPFRQACSKVHRSLCQRRLLPAAKGMWASCRGARLLQGSKTRRHRRI